MNEIEAKRIAAVVSIVRPDWRTGLVMSVLGDERLRHRAYEDVLVAAVACYADSTTAKPGRIHEPGHWWLTVTATAPPAKYRTITPADCGICLRPAELHSRLSAVDDHEWEPQQPTGVGPTDEQRAALEAARIEAEKARTAERKPEPKREPRDPAEVIQSHIEETA